MATELGTTVYDRSLPVESAKSMAVLRLEAQPEMVQINELPLATSVMFNAVAEMAVTV